MYRLILPSWAYCKDLPKVLEGEFTEEELRYLNEDGYNIYFLPNYPSNPEIGKPVDGPQIDVFRYVYVDMDLKEGVYATKEEFTLELDEATEKFLPSLIVNSGNGVHAYWEMHDLDAMSFLRLQRRLCRYLKTDEAVAKIYQLMRVPGTINNKSQDEPKLCEALYTSESKYTCEQLDKLLPPITQEDEKYCQQHYDKTYSISRTDVKVDEKIPLKFAQLIKDNKEVKEIWSGGLDDRSKGDYRLGHIMFASGLTKEEATSVLVNSAKALSRAPVHRLAYAQNIIEKIWTFENTEHKEELTLSSTVREILQKSGDSLKGTRFPCWSYLDGTEHGFRLGQVIGLVAGSGVGKTAVALNMFLGFVQSNPDYDHFFVPLEQPANEIADRWRTMCGTKTHLHDKVHVISNYGPNGEFRHLSFDEIRDYILKFQETTGRKAGCVVIDHIGALRKKGAKSGENQDLMDICHSMKAFAVQTNTLLVMQSQAPREKAGIGDLELNKDAAYGTVFFESYTDFLVTIWQPLKRCYSQEGCPTVTAFKFCKIRHKKKGRDQIHEDVCYRLLFDSAGELLRPMTQDEDKAFDFFNNQATNLRKRNSKTDLIEYVSVRDELHGNAGHSQDSKRAS